MDSQTRLRRIQIKPDKTLDLGFGYFNFSTRQFRPYAGLRPNVLLLGAQKCGTSSLAYYLSLHPDIHASAPVKEPGFYLFDEWSRDYWKRFGKNYRNRNQLLRKAMVTGYTGQRWFLEATTWYTMPSVSAGLNIPEKVKGKVEKGLYIVRNPFDRMISAYNNFYKGKVNEGFNKVFDADSSLLEISLYFKQLQPFIERLGSDNIYVVIFEELIADIPGTLHKIEKFLKLDPTIPAASYPALNEARDKTRHTYSRENFERLMEQIVPDTLQLEDFMGRPTGWDFSTASWLGDG